MTNRGDLIGDYLATLANAKFVKFPKSSQNMPQVSSNCLLSVFVFAKRSPEVLEMFKSPATIRGP